MKRFFTWIASLWRGPSVPVLDDEDAIAPPPSLVGHDTPTVGGMPAVAVPPPPAPHDTEPTLPSAAEPAPAPTGPTRTRGLHGAHDTIFSLPAFVQEEVERMAAQKRAAEADAAKPEAGPTVSPTRWFMSAVDPDQLAEGEAADLTEVEQMSERYSAQDELPSELRQRYSLEK